MRLLVFGAIGTEVFVDGRHYELVSLDEDQKATWRAKCLACHAPIFTAVRWGNVPVKRYCTEHESKRLKIEDPPGPTMDEIVQTQERIGIGAAPPDFFAPPGKTREHPIEPVETFADMAREVEERAWPGTSPETIADLISEEEEHYASAHVEPTPAPAPSPRNEIMMWDRRVQVWLNFKMWQPDWGPRPGQAGCKIPYVLFEHYRIEHLAHPVQGMVA